MISIGRFTEATAQFQERDGIVIEGEVHCLHTRSRRVERRHLPARLLTTARRSMTRFSVLARV